MVFHNTLFYVDITCKVFTFPIPRNQDEIEETRQMLSKESEKEYVFLGATDLTPKQLYALADISKGSSKFGWMTIENMIELAEHVKTTKVVKKSSDTSYVFIQKSVRFAREHCMTQKEMKLQSGSLELNRYYKNYPDSIKEKYDNNGWFYVNTMDILKDLVPECF